MREVSQARGPRYLQLPCKPAVPGGVVEVQVVEEVPLQALLLLLITHPSEEQRLMVWGHSHRESGSRRGLGSRRVNPCPRPLVCQEEEVGTHGPTGGRSCGLCLLGQPPRTSSVLLEGQSKKRSPVHTASRHSPGVLSSGAVKAGVKRRPAHWLWGPPAHHALGRASTAVLPSGRALGLQNNPQEGVGCGP